MHFVIYFAVLVFVHVVLVNGMLRQDADNDGNLCYSDGDNYDVTQGARGTIIDDDGTARADFMKCLPPNSDVHFDYAQKVYKDLKLLHDKLCTHLEITYSDEVNKVLENIKLGRPPFYCDPQIDYEEEYGDRCYEVLYKPVINRFKHAMLDVFRTFKMSKLTDAPACTDDVYKTYHYHIGMEGNEMVVKSSKLLENNQDSLHYDLNSVSYCDKTSTGEDEGGACLWMLEPELLDTLPHNQQNKFDNTNFLQSAKDAGNVYKSQIDSMVGAGAGDSVVIYKDMMKNMLTHCHLSIKNTGFLRIHYQHDHEHRYPQGFQRVCFCNWRHLAQLVNRCGCTRDGNANNQCGNDEAALMQSVGVRCNNCNYGGGSKIDLVNQNGKLTDAKELEK